MKDCNNRKCLEKKLKKYFLDITFGVIANTVTQETINAIVSKKYLAMVCAL